jgi:hypothetical protein
MYKQRIDIITLCRRSTNSGTSALTGVPTISGLAATSGVG